MKFSFFNGCFPKCTTRTHVYNFQEKINGKNDIFEMRKDWISSFYLFTRTTTNYTSVESYSYDEQAEYQHNSYIQCHFYNVTEGQGL